MRSIIKLRLSDAAGITLLLGQRLSPSHVHAEHVCGKRHDVASSHTNSLITQI
ncbi:hypothetical protein K439DRAFT_1629299 [Ramaria rubella]|nr:hypothetical protein K439DRAFT_1629299 [Ramaria rubella]